MIKHVLYLSLPPSSLSSLSLSPSLSSSTAIKDRIVGLLLFMGKLCVVAIMTLLAYLVFGQYEEYGRAIWQRELNYYLVPLIVSHTHIGC